MSVGERLSTAGSLVSREEDELARVLAAYMGEVEAGRPVDAEEWVERHPAIAERLRTCLKGLNLVEEVAGAIGVGSLARRAEDDGPRLGDFRILRALGRGGMGVVYEAVEGSLGRRVALKVLPLGAAIDPRRLARFRVEAQAAAQLHHPHIIPVYSVGSESGVHYYAMQLIQGVTVAELITELRRLEGPTGNPERTGGNTEHVRSHDELAGIELGDRADPAGCEGSTDTSEILSSISTHSPAFSREAARLGLEAALALEHAHQNGVLHRDIKPSNLMVESNGHLWVADFGLARFQGEGSLTASGDLLGTLRYMSPEQALANRGVVDERTDVYSLGATLYELITLRPAFEGSNRQNLLRQIAQDEPSRPRRLKPTIPIELETIVMKAMAKDPVSRYATARELAEDLGRFLDDQPILARKPPVVERLTRFARRHMAVVLAVVPLLFVMVAGLAVGIALLLAKQREILIQQSEIGVKKAEAERSRADARRQRDAARRAVDEMYSRVAQNWLNKETSLQPLQRDFLLKALAYYDQFAHEDDAEPEIRIAAGWASLRVGDIQRRLGKTDAGEQGYRRAIETLETLGRGEPLGPEILDPLAAAYAGLGELLDDSGRSDGAKRALDRSVDLTRALIDGIPKTPETLLKLATHNEELGTSLGRGGHLEEALAAYRSGLALAKSSTEPAGFIEGRLLMNMATILNGKGKFDEAEPLYRQAIERYESMVKLEPAFSRHRENLGMTIFNLALMLAKYKGQMQEAEQLLHRAQGLFERLTGDAPGVAEYQAHLAITLCTLANIASRTDRLPEALELAQRSTNIFKVLADESPTLTPFRQKLAYSLSLLALTQSKSGAIAPALENAQRAQELHDKLDARSDDLQIDVARNLANLGHLMEVSGKRSDADKFWRRAVSLFDLLATRFPGQPDYQSELAHNLREVARISASNDKKEDADRDYRRGLKIFERLLSEDPRRSVDRFRLSALAQDYTVFLDHNGRLEEAEKVSVVAFQAYRQLVKENYQRDLMLRGAAEALKNRAIIQAKGKRLADAEKTYLEAIELFDSLPAEAAREVGYRESHGMILERLGELLNRRGRSIDAEQRFLQAVKVREELVASSPNNSGAQSDLAQSQSHLGIVLAARGEVVEARRLLQQSVGLREKAMKADPHDRKGRARLAGERKTLAAFLIGQGAYVECAVVVDKMTRDSDPAQSAEWLSVAAINLSECASQALQDETLSRNAREAAALSYALKAREAFYKAAEPGNDDVATRNLAWYLLICPVADVRDPDLATRLARGLTERSPQRSDSWSFLGAARYRAGDLPAAVSALQRGAELNQGKVAFWGFFLAMAHWRLDHMHEARECFDRADDWLKANPTNKPQLGVRAEAAALLGMPERVPVSEQGRRSEAKPDRGRGEPTFTDVCLLAARTIATLY